VLNITVALMEMAGFDEEAYPEAWLVQASGAHVLALVCQAQPDPSPRQAANAEARREAAFAANAVSARSPHGYWAQPV
jgi:hypothetical protein